MAYRVMVGKPEGNRPLGMRRRKWEIYIKTELQEVGWTRLKLLRIWTGGGIFDCGNELPGSVKCG
jgi:hypothetical protein